MLSEKMTLSLTCLVVLLAFGLAFYVPTASADHGAFDVTIESAPGEVDVSSADGMQIASGRDRAARTLTEGVLIRLLIKSAQVVNLAGPELGVQQPDLAARAVALDIKDLIIDAYDAQGRSLGVLADDAEADTGPVVFSHLDANNPGKNFLVEINATELTDAYTAARGGGQTLEIHTLLFSIPKDAMERADQGYVTARRNDAAHAESKNKRAEVFKVELVDDDEGVARYNPGVGGDPADAGVPGVVTIERLNERMGIIEPGDFDVRIILTEEPKGGLTPELIMATNATVKDVREGISLKGLSTTPAQASELTFDIASYTTMAGTAAAALTDLPEATGRDNMYHQYFAKISPKLGFDGTVTVSVKQFDDQVQPAGMTNTYIPLAAHQVVSRTLADTEETVRDARVMNEMVTVRVHTIADAKVDAATKAYEARQKEVLDKVANEITLANKTYIPAGGFLVLTADVAKAGIQASDAKTKDKLGAELLYNTHGLGLPFPADDLDNFFRNGGELNLGYADIPEATGSGHGDSKGATGDDATGYTAADSTAYAKGALIINEIMWGLDGAQAVADVKNSQYIELHNTTAAAIGIDNKEWVISVGSLPAGYTAIDTVNNNPASGYWEVPGMGGVTAATPANPTVIDLVSMSRVAGGADGSMADSWAASMRPSANISGRRIGTPGAANSYVMPPAAPEPTPEPPAPTTPAAEADDIMISEIMVASNEGRLPQWVELANVSGAAVSLTGWSLSIENDSADADVVAASVDIDLSSLEIGEDQVALVVSKTGRNSGVSDRAPGDANQGDLDSKRILNVQDMVSPDNARYSLISEMGFMLTLMPPATPGSAIRSSGDHGGNLGMGWDAPMSEGGRSSLIRREMGTAGEVMGTDAAGWVLASDTNLDGAYRTTYYGSDEDSGTPGYNAGGALPVELSGFNAARDRLTGQITITWETQSELNNAGFFIKRSETKNGKFVVVNPAMIAGAGTTAEKQSYTYTDTSAKPNVVYYYQIEDVSLDGNRQILTRAHRLKGHLSPVGNKTVKWGELKSQE